GRSTSEPAVVVPSLAKLPAVRFHSIDAEHPPPHRLSGVEDYLRERLIGLESGSGGPASHVRPPLVRGSVPVDRGDDLVSRHNHANVPRRPLHVVLDRV